MKLLKVVTLWILALKVANTSGGTKLQIEVIVDVGGLDSSPDMTTIALIHTIYGFGFGMRNHSFDEREDKYKSTIKAERGKKSILTIFNLS